MKLIKARELATEYQFSVHLDETKFKDGEPDPDYVVEYTWGKEPPPGRTKAQYLNDIKREIKLLTQHELARRLASETALSMEGTVF